MKFKVADLLSFKKKSVKPEPGVQYHVYSLPGFDNRQTPEFLMGEDIKSTKYAVQPKTILMNKLNVGFKRVWLIDQPLDNSIASTEFIPLSVSSKDELNLQYMYYFLTSREVTEVLKKASTGTSNSHQRINADLIADLDIDLPSLREQKLIADKLAALDSKITLNQEINDNLLELALTEYRQKVATTAITQMKLDDIAKVSAGGDKPKLVSDLASDEMRVPIYSNGITNEGLYGFTDTPKIFDKAVTVSARGTIGYLAIREEPYYPIVRLISVIPTLEKFTIHQLYLALTDTNIQGFGTTQQQLTVPVFKSTMLPILPEETRTEIEELISPMFDMIAHNKHEIVTLSETRDSLLKKLI